MSLIFYVLSLVLFALAAGNTPSSRVHLGWAGMFSLTLAYLIATRFGSP
jgi:hypothetical protein